MTAGANMTSASNMTGNTTVGAHGSSIPTTHPAGIFNPRCPPGSIGTSSPGICKRIG